MENQEFRTKLPSKSVKNDTSIWTVLKTCMGKDLSKITMPVQFNEPLTFLQRLSEYMEYSEILNNINFDDPVTRMEHVAAFAVSGLASNWKRVSKPFNPLLGETFELCRDGYRLIAEQVSHHPPISAFHAESSKYVFQGWIHPKLKLWGKSVEIHPKGNLSLYLKEYDETYRWSNVDCIVHNVIVGKLWIEQSGVMSIHCEKTSLTANLEFKTTKWFNSELHKTEGFVMDERKNKLRYIYGKWTEAMRSTDIQSYQDFCKNNRSEDGMKKSPAVSPSPPRKMLQKFNSLSLGKSLGTSIESPPDVELSPENQEDHMPKAEAVLHDIPNSTHIWEATTRPSYSNEYYNFTLFAMSLNEILPNQDVWMTDSRLRPDCRKLEEGDMKEAGLEKLRLEDKQRKSIKAKTAKSPVWFEKVGDDWQFNGRYWKASKQISPSKENFF